MTGDHREEAGVVYRVSPPLDPDELNGLLAAAWGDHEWRDFEPHLLRFYAGCGFRRTEAGLLRLGSGEGV